MKISINEAKNFVKDTLGIELKEDTLKAFEIGFGFKGKLLFDSSDKKILSANRKKIRRIAKKHEVELVGNSLQAFEFGYITRIEMEQSKASVF